MTSPYFSAKLAEQHTLDLLRQADRHRLSLSAKEQGRTARPARHSRSWSLRSLVTPARRRAFV
jgi:hypothetical protein